MQRRTYLGAFAGVGTLTSTRRALEPDESDREPPKETATRDTLLDESERKRITEFLETHVSEGTFPGAAVAVVNEDGQLYRNAVGAAQNVPVVREMTEETVFDLASVTKAVATATSVVQLIDRGALRLDDSLCGIYCGVPEEEYGKCDITIEHLLTHTSGYPAWLPLWTEMDSPDHVIDHILRDTPLDAEPGTKVTYSGLGYILLGDIVHRVSGSPLDEYADENIFEPLEMTMTAYNPLDTLPDDRSYAATEDSAYYGEVVVGEVHDENAAFLGGVSGNAGLFSTIDDLSTYAMAMLNCGKVNGTQILSKQAVKEMTGNWTADLDGERGLGWDLTEMFGHRDSGTSFDTRTFGHNGFTGTSIWFAPQMDFSVVTLTNRVHPSRDNYAITDFRPAFHNLIASLVSG
ncbi:serine hydrolase domain-containing protein [Haladaptatus caseinilyticus]|uniref:serine hydrolase domain-containing protein n=1 Tax=Haladaptatus caseinilyticus TaxID=2993314 RepID=UPI00224B423F|nr:serine hydrolase domain-containing protein [Haladaptatus caseinilyticus]